MMGGQADRKTQEMAMLWVLNLSDGQHSLLDNNQLPSAKHLSDHLPVLTVIGV